MPTDLALPAPVTAARRPARRVGEGARLLIVALMLVASLLGAWLIDGLIATHRQARFDYELGRIESAVQQRMTAYVQILRGGLGLFQHGSPVTREDWLRYVATLELDQRYPGFKSLTFAEAVRPEDLPAFLARVRAEPLPPGLVNADLLRHFTLRSPAAPSSPPLHAPIVYVAPLIPANERVLGVDMMQEPQRRAAMERAADSRQAVLSPRIKLFGQGDQKAGFIAYLAVHRADGSLYGWLTAAFLAEDFMRGLLGPEAGVLNFELYDDGLVQPEALLYSTAGITPDGMPRALSAAAPTPLTAAFTTTYERVKHIQLLGRQWTLRCQAPPSFVSLADRLAPWLVAIGGLLATALFYFTSRSSARLHAALDQVAEHNRLLHLEVEERHRAEAEVRHQATHDPLTGLANRSLFMDRVETALQRSRRSGQAFALIYIDIDGFKAVNDTHGHHAGDALLKAIATRLQAKLRGDDTLSRLAGDEFAVILEQMSDPPAVAQRIVTASWRLLPSPLCCTKPAARFR